MRVKYLAPRRGSDKPNDDYVEGSAKDKYKKLKENHEKNMKGFLA